MNEAQWRITFPIEKAERRDDGYHIVGLASGPEVDADGERMAAPLIHRFAEQINATDGMPLVDRLVYRDAHLKDGVMRDLGWLAKAWVTPEGRLGVDVLLDSENPAARYLFAQLERGKKFGMSVAGQVLDYVDEFVSELGKTVRTYKSVLLTEISNTTRPAWTPSFGSVLTKAIDEAKAESGAAEGVTVVDDELNTDAQDETAPVEDTNKSDESPVEETDKSADEQPSEETEEVVEEKSDDATDEAPAEDETEKAGRKFSAAARTRLLGMYAEIGDALKELGLLEGDEENKEPEKSDSETADEENIDKSSEEPDEVSALRTQVEELVRKNGELAAEVEVLKANRTTLPPVIEKADAPDPVDDFMKSLTALEPSARLRAALAAKYGGGVKS